MLLVHAFFKGAISTFFAVLLSHHEMTMFKKKFQNILQSKHKYKAYKGMSHWSLYFLKAFSEYGKNLNWVFEPCVHPT